MKKLCLALVLLACSAFSLADDRPTDASVKALLQAMHAQTMFDAQMAQMGEMFDATVNPALAGKKISPDLQQDLAIQKVKFTAIITTEMNWGVMEPIMVDVYAKSFTQQEIDGMLAFYTSPAGQSVIKKMPLVVQNSNQVVQARTQGIMQKLQKLIQESIQQIRKTQ